MKVTRHRVVDVGVRAWVHCLGASAMCELMPPAVNEPRFRATQRALGLRRLEEEAVGIERHRKLWGSRFQELDGVVEQPKKMEKGNGRKKRK